jgi:CxxC motif-containing protein (DUF1111 family)
MTRSARTTILITTATAICLGALSATLGGTSEPTEAPAAFDNRTNGFVSQTEFDALRATFEERDEIADGLGPVYNAQSCAECHQTPLTGGSSQVSELRAGHADAAGQFVEAPGGSLINDRAIHARIQETVPGAEKVRTLRTSPSVLGVGFVEAIRSGTLAQIANAQPGQSGGAIAGEVIRVPVLEMDGAFRVGRFGWKNQHASLLSFSADAYLNEIGITSRLQPVENTSMGRAIARFDAVPDPEDTEDDIDGFAAFMRATKAPPRDGALAATPDATAGAALFNQVGCNICHVPSIVTAPAGTLINGGALTVPPALGNKIIHPFSDYLLHDVGSGDGIVQNGGPSTANKVRTAPLWGLRARSRHMHDGEALTLLDAIRRHGGEAAGVVYAFRTLSATRRNQILAFLESL